VGRAMIFTDRFVYLHLPKTGGTFVTEMLQRLYCPHPSLLRRLANLAPWRDQRFRGPHGVLIADRNKHGIRSEVPPIHRRKPVLATVRNPFDRYVSMYEFGWWRRPEWLPTYRRLPDFARRFPAFPTLTFDEYVRLESEAYADLTPERFADPHAVGLHTQDFVRQYCWDPRRVLERIQEGRAVDWQTKLDGCRFLRTSDLNGDLHRFLADSGYPPDAIAFVLDHAKVMPGKGRTPEQRWEAYYTPELKRIVRAQERALFELFPEFDV
jgi:hypothetical protein